MSTTATRLITLIMLLQRRSQQKAGELAEALGVSVRTIHRYINMLDEMGIPVYAERGPHGGYSLVRGYKMPPLVFTPEEAVAVYLGSSMVREVWGPLYEEAAQGAMAKLENVLPDEQRHEVGWARRTLIATGLHRDDHTSLAPMLKKLRRAARERRRVTMVYQSRSRPEPLERDVDPYALVYRWGWWYLIGHCHLRDDLRVFRVDRLVELSVGVVRFEAPANFDVQTYLEQTTWFPARVQVRMRFAPEAASEVWEERSSWETIEEQADGSIIVTFGATDMAWAARIALWHGPHAEVLAPAELRDQVRARAQATAEQYTSET